MRVDEEQILGNPVTLAMPKACINPIDPTETWNDDWMDGYDSVVCSWREDDDGKIEVMSKYTKQLKTVRKIHYAYSAYKGKWHAKYITIPEPPTDSLFNARALFDSGQRMIDMLPDRYSVSKHADQEFVDNLNRHLRELRKIVKNPSLYDIDWGESYREWQILIDEDIKIAVRSDGYGYMYISAWESKGGEDGK